MSGSKQKNIGGVNSLNDSEKVRDRYNQWAIGYEDDLNNLQYRLPQIMAKMACDWIENKRSRILDAGCGTGLSGAALHQEGFVQLIGQDFSRPMLEQAKKKNCYHELFVSDLCQLPDQDASYDHALAIGTIGVAPARAMCELARVVKPGGRVLFSNRTGEHFDKKSQFVSTQKEMEEKGSWKLLKSYEDVVADNKINSDPFIIFVYEVL